MSTLRTEETYYRTKGRTIQARLRKKSGNGRFRVRDAAKEVMKLRALGWPDSQIATALGVTERMVRYYARAATEMNQKATGLAPIEPNFKRMLEWDVDAFAEFFTTFSSESYFPAHVKPWIRAFLRERNLLLNVPPRHAKSIFFATWIPIWLICRDRNVQVLLISETHDFARSWALEIAGQLEHNDALIKAFGRFAPATAEERKQLQASGQPWQFEHADQKWQPASGAFSVVGRTRKAKGAQFTVESRGMSGQVLGREADFVIVDDPTNQEISESETQRKAQLKHLREQVFSRAEPESDKPGGRIVVVGQRVHLLDLYGVLEKQEYEAGPLKGQKLFHTEKYPAVLDWESKSVLWPKKFSWDEMMLTYARVGGHGPFSCMYQQEPMPEGSALVTRAWLDACKDHARPARQGPRGEYTQTKGFLPIVRVLSVDPSPTKFNGIVVGDLLCDKENFAFSITEVVRMKAGIRELAAECDRIIDSQRPDYFIFEESGFLTWFRDDPWFMALKDRIKTIRHHTGVNKNSMEYGVQSLATDFEFARISLPYGDDLGRRMSDMLGNEALMWPDGDTTDLLMALWFVKFNYKKLSPLRFLPTRIKGHASGGWSWYSKLKSKGETQEQFIRRWQKEKAKEKVSA